jgi:hypothetical protein
MHLVGPVTLLVVGCVLEGCPGDEYAKVSPYVEPWSQARLDEIYLDACHDARRRFTSMVTHALPADTVEHYDKLAQWFQLRPVRSRPLDASSEQYWWQLTYRTFLVKRERLFLICLLRY